MTYFRNTQYSFMHHATLKKYPFIRLLAGLIIGILLQWYLEISIYFIVAFTLPIIIAITIFSFLSLSKKYNLRWLQGILYILLISCIGAFITWSADIQNNKSWYGNHYKKGDLVCATLQEPLAEKTNSFKAEATVNAIYENGRWIETKGDILLYLDKDSLPKNISYGSTIIFKKNLQTIANSGNPGCFDYKRYCLFHAITGQVYLKPDEFELLQNKNSSWLNSSLFYLRDLTIQTLQRYIPEPKEQGVAEALLIGYREDLDKDLVQAYSNTGVVHIIAISGLHIGMIYAALVAIFTLFKRNRFTSIVKPIIILLIIWAFTLIAGAVPSIMRSAVMFSFIVVGDCFRLKTNMYNTLAASAFCMLVANPFVLWDVGFLLSYTAVISIVTFQKYIYNLLYIQNKLLNKIWALCSVTLSAQILTLPIVIFYFHQLPSYFLITNLLVVPLSGLVLAGEVILLCLAPLTILATLLGAVIQALIKFMNTFIEFISSLPFAVLKDLHANVLQVWLLYGLITFFCIWFVRKWKTGCIIALSFALLFIATYSVNSLLTANQQKLIVYNVPKQTAIDLIQGNNYFFAGDSEILNNDQLMNYNLKPSHLLYNVAQSNTVQNWLIPNQVTTVAKHSILLIDNNFSVNEQPAKIPVDIIIISKNPKLYMNKLSQQFTCSQIVFDSSNPLWKILRWKKDCDSLHLRFHSVPEQGAFVADL